MVQKVLLFIFFQQLQNEKYFSLLLNYGCQYIKQLCRNKNSVNKKQIECFIYAKGKQ